MKNKKYIYSITILLCGMTLLQSCKKEEVLNVDLSQYNIDSPVKSELDKWIGQTLTDPYNIELIYRFERNETDPARNISPIELNRVKPTVEAILYTFLKVYEDIAGPDFIKKYTPKQFVLYGSPSYNSNGSITLGTAEGGRKIVLYELNELNFSNSQQVRRKMRTIHHEFTHIINQMVAIPPSFEQVTKADYEADWTNTTSNSEAISRSLGFISRYSRSAPGEDFAETVAHLIVEGQLYYDNYAKQSGSDAYQKLKRKEALVVDYFKQYYNIDFKAIQQAFAKVAIEQYNENDVFSLGYWMRQGTLINSIKVDPIAAYNTKYQVSEAFKTLYSNLKTGVAAVGNANRHLDNIEFQFGANSELEVVATYTNTAGSSFMANYSYSYKINTANEITFTKVAQRGTTGVYGNADVIKAGMTSLEDYLTKNTFVLDWTQEVDANDYLNLGGFYVKGDRSNYVFGNIIR